MSKRFKKGHGWLGIYKNSKEHYLRIICVVALAVLVLVTSVSLFGCEQESKDTIKSEGAIPLTTDDRILVVAPHPDDEALGQGALIQRAVADDISVQVVIMTCGDGFKRAARAQSGDKIPAENDYVKLGELREKESIEAMKQLGLESEDIKFLGYPDGFIDLLFDTNWDYDNLVTGLTGKSDAPYSFAYEKNAPYCGANVVKNLTDIVDDFKPTIIVYPNPNDMHDDHWATNAFVQYAISTLDYDAKDYTYLVHRGSLWPVPPLYRPEEPLSPPEQLTHTDTTWIRSDVTDEENLHKEAAIASYKSQIELMEPYLKSFIRENELFSQNPDISIGHVDNKAEALRYTRDEGKILIDPVNDSLLRSIAGLGDIEGVWFLEGPDKFWFIVETTEGVEPDLVYTFSMRIFNESDVDRLDIQVLDNEVTVEMIAENSIEPDEPVLAENEEKRLVIELPSEVFDDARSMMVNVSTFKETSILDNWIDRTAWRLVDLKE